MIRWAAETGADAALVAEKILASKAHPEQGFKSVLGLIRLGEKYGKDRLNIACRHAIKIGSPKYQTIQSILVRNIDKTLKDSENSAEKELPNHDNIRGASYYH
jgi:hypothetical protein